MLDNNINNNNNRVRLCECGCNIRFIEFSIGCDIYFIHDGRMNNKIISEEQMVNGSRWRDYIKVEFKTWGELWNHIDANKNEDPVFFHLYNEYRDLDIPADAVLEMEIIL